MVAGVQRFLAQMRSRRRWTMYPGAPEGNINAGSDEESIYIIDLLPFRRDHPDALTTSVAGLAASRIAA